MPSAKEWERVDPSIVEGIQRFRHLFTKNAEQHNLPKDYPHPELGAMLEGVKTDYTCGIEVVRLALKVQHKYGGQSDAEIGRAMGLSELGVDQWPMVRGMQSLGVECEGREGMTVGDLEASLAGGGALEILSVQQGIGASKRELIEAEAGHYVVALCLDSRYVYCLDPGLPPGIVRLKREYLPYLWYDVEMTSRRIVYGFGARVPISD